MQVDLLPIVEWSLLRRTAIEWLPVRIRCCQCPALIAQLAERETFNLVALGSIPNEGAFFGSAILLHRAPSLPVSVLFGQHALNWGHAARTGHTRQASKKPIFLLLLLKEEKSVRSFRKDGRPLALH